MRIYFTFKKSNAVWKYYNADILNCFANILY